jgi:hypothetical protein
MERPPSGSKCTAAPGSKPAARPVTWCVTSVGLYTEQAGCSAFQRCSVRILTKASTIQIEFRRGFLSSSWNIAGWGHAVAWWLRHFATSRKVAGSRSDEVNDFFSTHLIIPAALGPGVYSASNRMSTRSRKIMFLGSRARPVRRADDLTAICVPIV